MVHYDGTVHNSLGDLVQFVYGKDGMAQRAPCTSVEAALVITEFIVVRQTGPPVT